MSSVAPSFEPAELLMVQDVAEVVAAASTPVAPTTIRAAVARGDLSPSFVTPRRVKLFTRAVVLEYAARRVARQAAK